MKDDVIQKDLNALRSFDASRDCLLLIANDLQILADLHKPKTPYYVNRHTHACPNCFHKFCNKQHPNFCPDCGQHLHWHERGEHD